ncbi:hypothetical protein K4F52_006089 [Lecanicillium sp. MT-2017a]|nr:hypothetical protein K4F52_006089 [Lecanicillium sp. MT-2017a]
MVLFLEETKYTMTTTVAANNATGTRHHQGPDERHKADTEQENATSQEIHHHLDPSIPMKSKWSRLALVHHDASQQSWSAFAQHFWLPFAITFTIPAVMFCAIMYGFGFSCLSVVLVTQAELYPEPPYNFSPVGVGNVIVAPAIGGILGCIAGGQVFFYMGSQSPSSP